MAERITFEIYSEKYPGIRRRDIAERLSITAVAHTTATTVTYVTRQVNVQVPASLSVASTGVGLQQTNVQLTISLNTASTGVQATAQGTAINLPIQGGAMAVEAYTGTYYSNISTNLNILDAT